MNSGVENGEGRARRRRRTAEVARREILDAAKKKLMDGGPESVTLKQIGEEIGLSHSSILHHFGSRDALMEALRDDAFAALARDLAERMAKPPEGDPTIDLFEKVAQTLGEQGYGRLLAWQLMSGNLPDRGSVGQAVLGPDGSGGLLAGLADQLQAIRVAHATHFGRPEPDVMETRRVVASMACALLGEALAGEVMVRSAGLAHEADSRRTLRGWLAKQAEKMVFPDVAQPEAATGADPAPPRPVGPDRAGEP